MKRYISLILFALLLFCSNFSMPFDKERFVGIKVKSDPSIAIKIWFNVGSQNDPVGKEGLANLTSALLSEGGTKEKTYSQILEELYPIATSYYANSSVEMTMFSGRTHTDNIESYYNLYIDQLLNPAFREEDFNRLKQNQITYLETTLRYSSDEELGKAVLYNQIFNGTGYGHITEGTISGLNNITLEDVRDFYKKYFNKNNFVIGLSGNYSDELVKKLWTDLNKLPDGEWIKTAKPIIQKIEGLNYTLIEKKANASAISFGFPIDILRGSREWYALAIANSWLGEHRNSSSHLYQVIREARGLNYGDYSYIENFPNGGRYSMPPQNVARKSQIFEIWIRPVPNETRLFSFRAAMRELTRLVDNGLSKDEFELTKTFLKKYVLHYAKNSAEKLGYAIDDKFYGLKSSHLTTFRKMMDEITLDEVNNAIKKHLQYQNMEIVFITEGADKLREEIINGTPSPITYPTSKPETVLEEDKEIIVFPISTSENNIRIKKVEELFNK
jgi:zinc protease